MDQTDKLIDHLRQKTLPACPDNLEQNVLRKVRLQGTEMEPAQTSAPGLKLFLSTCLVMLLFTSGISFGVSRQQTRAEMRQRLAASALDFDVLTHTGFQTAHRRTR